MKKLLILLSSLLIVCTGLSAQEVEDLDITYAKDLVKKGAKAPDFTLQGLDGKTYTLKDFRGKTVVVDFWATWCPDCRKEIDYLVSLHRQYPDVLFLGISFDTDPAQLEKFTREHGMDWLQLSEWKKWKETKVSADYHIKWIPTKYVIDPKGKVILSTVMTEKVEKYLKGRR